LLFNSNTTGFTRAWPTGEAIYMQTSNDGLNWGSPTAILAKAPNICDMADARPIYDTAASLWRVFVQAVTYSSSTACDTSNQIFEATGTSLSHLSWYGNGGNATPLTNEPGTPGIGESMQWFNTANYHGPLSSPILAYYNDWNFSPGPDCKSCVGNGTDIITGVFSGGQLFPSYFMGVAYGKKYNDTDYFLTYPDFFLGGSADEQTLGAPGFGLDSDCTNGIQIGRGLAFYPTPVQDNTLVDQPWVFVAFPQGSTNYPTYPGSQSGLIISVRAARNPYGFLDKISSSPNTWQTYIYYNAADEKNGTKCPVPTIQSTFRNLGLPGSPSARWAVSELTITEQ